MADTKEAVEEMAAAAPAVRGGMMQLIVLAVVMMITVLGSLGGALFWLMKTNRLPVQGAPAAAVQEKPKPEPTRMVILDPLLVNLADSDGQGYLRVVVAVRVADPPPGKDAKPKDEKPPEKGKPVVVESEVRMRDAALAVLGRETSERLLAPDGKEHLKLELKEAFAAQVPDTKVIDIMFTEFLVQR